MSVTALSSTPARPGPQVRLVDLDVLRAVAISLVIFRHMELFPRSGPAAMIRLMDTLKTGGWIGVDIFFVLSGFLVARLLLSEFRRTNTVRPGRFLVRRGFKIYPAFYSFLILSFGLYALFGRRTRFAEWASEVFFVQSYRPSVHYHTWSLAVEEHFYLLLALVVWSAVRRGTLHRATFVIQCMLVAAATLALRVAFTSREPFSYYSSLFASHLRMDSFAIGAAVAWVAEFQPSTIERMLRYRPQLILIGAALLAPAFMLNLGTDRFLDGVGLTLFAVGSAALVIACLRKPPALMQPKAVIAALGAQSYSIYLWHIVANEVAWKLFPRHATDVAQWAGYAAAYVVLAVLVGIAAARLIERPALAIRERLSPASTPS